MPKVNTILIEVMYKADYCLPCLYMDRTVQEVLPKYRHFIEYHRVEFLKGEGKKRFLELSCSLYGEEMVNRHCRLAPVPSLFIDGELIFDAIPPIFELEDAIEEAIQKKKIRQKQCDNAIYKNTSGSSSRGSPLNPLRIHGPCG
jgi:polynucleotide 5'-kinase involved in rRNA processing